MDYDSDTYFPFHIVHGSALHSRRAWWLSRRTGWLSLWTVVGRVLSGAETIGKAAPEEDRLLFSQLIAVWWKLLYSLGHETYKSYPPQISERIRG